MYDNFNRQINYLRLSVTDRCNLRCIYCMPDEGIKLLPHSDILTFNEIRDFTEIAVAKGVSKVRITGGEPLVRKGIITLVKMISGIKGIPDLSMTTNGVLLKQFASDLKKAGLHRINISLDTIDPEKFLKQTRNGNINDVFEGIEAAIKAGLYPVKINCVVERSRDEKSAMEVAGYCRDQNLPIRYIKQMDLVQGHFSTVEGGSGGDCARCNRLRLTANGMLKPCLFNNIEFDIRKIGFEQAIDMAVALKPRCGSVNNTGAFYNIGG
jgi:GTP 3',8-cyclase